MFYDPEYGDGLNFKPEMFIFASGKFGLLVYNLSNYDNPV